MFCRELDRGFCEGIVIWKELNLFGACNLKGEFFKYQLRALKDLTDRGISFWVAVMYDVFGDDGVKKLEKVLPVPCRIEFEYLERYPFVLENLRKRGIKV